MGKIKIFVTLLIGLLLPGFQAIADEIDYSDNIGFMKDVPTEWREMYPECDEFLNANWEEPDNTIELSINKFERKPYVYNIKSLYRTKIPVDIYVNNKKIRKILLIIEYIKGGTVDTFYLDKDEFLYKNTKKFIKFHCRARTSFYVQEGENRNLYIEKNRNLYNISHTLARKKKTVCVYHPYGRYATIIENNIPFLAKDDMSEKEKEQFYNMEKILKNQCFSFLYYFNINDENQINRNCSDEAIKESLSRAIKIDKDGDGIDDFIFGFVYTAIKFIFFYDEENKFIIPYPNECRLLSREDTKKCIYNKKNNFNM